MVKLRPPTPPSSVLLTPARAHTHTVSRRGGGFELPLCSHLGCVLRGVWPGGWSGTAAPALRAPPTEAGLRAESRTWGGAEGSRFLDGQVERGGLCGVGGVACAASEGVGGAWIKVSVRWEEGLLEWEGSERQGGGGAWRSWLAGERSAVRPGAKEAPP